MSDGRRAKARCEVHGGHRVLGVVNEDRRIPERVHAFEIRDFESTLTMRYSTPKMRSSFTARSRGTSGGLRYSARRRIF